MILKYLKYYGYLFLSIIISLFILTIINYFEIFTGSTISIFKLLIMVISIFINSYLLGKNSKNKGFIEGLKFGSIFTLFILLINLLFIKNFNIKIIIYYLLIIVTSMVGSTIGINRKKTN